VAGLAIWLVRPDFVETEFPKHGERFQTKNEVIDLGDRNDLCALLTNPNGFVLISGRLNIESLSSAQGFFQSAENEDGYFLDYDPGENKLVRFGIRLSDGTTSRVKLRNLTGVGVTPLVILVRGNGDIRMITGDRDSTTQTGNIAPVCTNWKIGLGNGSAVFKGQILLDISTGSDITIANELIENFISAYDKSLPSTLYKWPLYTGILLLVIGNPLRWRKK
jgi:hypothetical protein